MNKPHKKKIRKTFLNVLLSEMQCVVYCSHHFEINVKSKQNSRLFYNESNGGNYFYKQIILVLFQS